ncbi:hypothetical protein [Acanthopleuribacter pedis]|uniref:Uncharacterized protein n=1 Tax=Acanthopleuribacter pedis TaxID=442870 RepID=A0A8J7QBV7_9BACT|nr:hypothetical protein [Acanthopleuribacter pedis]MBO1320854.1 hypothetical protein [Acanthopleuribacter pedis]
MPTAVSTTTLMGLCSMVLWVAAGIPLQAQNAVYKLPSRAPKFNMITKDSGPKPGSKAPENAAPATYQRIYVKPAKMRMFIRAKCSDKLTPKTAVERAKSSTISGSGAVQIDWSSDIGDRDVQFWMVTVEETMTVKVNLVAKDGKYSVAGKDEKKAEKWSAKRIQVKPGGSACARQKDLDEKKIRIAVMNELTTRTLAHFRGAGVSR